MKYQPNRNYVSNDCVATPEVLVYRLVQHFNPKGRILEPCKGSGNFFKWLPVGSLWCEITEGWDFFAFEEKVDWIITNPPWSKMRGFLRHSMKVSDNVVFLMTINHLWTRARLRDMDELGFGIREIVLLDTPSEFPPLGFQLGAVWLKKGYKGSIELTDWRDFSGTL